ncbi:hypothetical protein DIZ81_02360 [Legionella taurinensis]|uniref:Uncharacterized protein n=2 Tax=Legionella taurinensis TaxID=70611 RepID=A0A3A5L330_9GAMM|nr:hypothetical protein [Legionella taurinensis]PUT41959.1 hypothetical protein DB744_02365 [Legionella taurinensis]PUT44748.1 hypothetical protein DB746_02365 [Legionella taurinensis]PUT48068.1 hypothetical protein DB743_00525 [Legionella taurinensis]PUT48883.1 hypothetical protein DB745_02365 [Legionella taurinensis]RJT45953.1 hypothetical protein D6J04_10175 [Legionella taurinensis]
MPNDQQTTLTTIISALKQLRPQIMLFKESMQDFKKQLETVSEEDELTTLVQGIDQREKELNQLLQKAASGMDKTLFDAICQQCESDSELTEIMAVFHADNSLANLITTTRERLGEQTLYAKLSGDELQMAKDFMQRLKQLSSVAQLLDAQKELFRQRLKEAEDTQTVDEIENDILAQHEGITKVYNAIIFYPDNERVAQALVEYFETNPQRLALVQAFHFYDSLIQDLADAKTRLKRA